MSFPSETVTKTVPLKFAGHDMTFHLSHALFSSHRIDDGTMLLLKTLAQQNRLPETGRALDAGCGVGPLAVALARHRPALRVSARDRLALACAFTRENARVNGVEVDVAPGLLLGEDPGPWDLIVSNLPAKAGEPVLVDFFRRAQGLLTPEGWACVVLVSTLAGLATEVLRDTGAEVGHMESTPAYHVFHFRRGRHSAPPPVPASVFPDVYRRGAMPFVLGKATHAQTTVFGLPNFDALDYRWKVSADALARVSWRRQSLLVWEPVQGHVVTATAAALLPGAELHLGGNDLLALRCSALGAPQAVLHAVATPDLLVARVGRVDAAVVQIHSEPEVPWIERTREALLSLLPPGAPVVVNGTSTDLARFLEAHKGLRKQSDDKYRGWRCVVFQRG